MVTGRQPPRATILAVDDDPETLDLLSEILEPSGFRVWRALSGAAALATLNSARPMLPDLIILDLILPGDDGLILCSELKAQAEVPIIVVSGSSAVRDRVLSLKLGADDFIAKPFNPDELKARIEAVLRRAGQARPAAPEIPSAAATASSIGPAAAASLAALQDQLRVGDLMVDPSRPFATLAGRPINLSVTEHRLLCALASHAGEVVGRSQLGQLIRGAEAGSGRSLDVHIHNLREKLSGAASSYPVVPPQIVSVRGFGYRLITPDEASGSGGEESVS